MYYDWPSLNMAYAADMDGNFPQYMFGDDIIVSPVGQWGSESDCEKYLSYRSHSLFNSYSC